jgi:hypothetical protein
MKIRCVNFAYFAGESDYAKTSNIHFRFSNLTEIEDDLSSTFFYSSPQSLSVTEDSNKWIRIIFLLNIQFHVLSEELATDLLNKNGIYKFLLQFLKSILFYYILMSLYRFTISYNFSKFIVVLNWLSSWIFSNLGYLLEATRVCFAKMREATLRIFCE